MGSEDIFIGNYRLISDIASGAFGNVYLAQHAFLTNRYVAIKLMRTNHLENVEEVARFLVESQFLERLKHPYILPIIDAGIHTSLPYQVTEYATGGSLRSRLQRQPSIPLPIVEAITILSQIGQALQYAHDQGIIHRDLKPENILFNEKGNAVIADFGMATMITTESIKQTSSAGTIAYMAPEQFQDTICKESDQYALGCIAYEMFTGHMPFQASNLASFIAKCLMEEPVAPRYYNPQLPEHIEQALLKAMAKQRKDRHTDVSAFITALINPPRLSEKAREEWMMTFIALATTFPGQKEQVIIACDQAIKLDPTFADAYYCKGVMLNDLKRYEDALKAFEYSIQLYPNYSTVWFYKGDLLNYFGKLEEAEQAYAKAKELYEIEAGETYDDFEDESDSYEENYLEAGEDFNNHFTNVLISEQSLGTAEEMNNKGLLLARQNQFQEALSAFEQALELRSNFPSAWSNKGDLLVSLGQYTEALHAYEQATQLSADYTDAYLGKADVLLHLKRNEEALDSIEHFIQISPKYARAYYIKGNILKALGRYEDALLALNRAILLDIQTASFHHSKGEILLKLERYEEALYSFDQAIQLDADNAYAYYQKGCVLQALERYQEALEAFDNAIKIVPNFAFAHIQKGYSQCALNYFQDAFLSFTQAIQLDSTNMYAYTGMSAVLENMQEYQEALQYTEIAIRLDSYSGLAWSRNATLLTKLDRHTEALQAFDKAIRLEPTLIDSYLNKAALLEKIDRYAEALVIIEYVLRSRENDAILHLKKGQVLLSLRRFEDANAAFEKALRLNPTLVDAYTGRGIALTKFHYPLEALQMFEIALKIMPDNPYLWFLKSSTLESIGRSVEAQQAYRVGEQLSLARQQKS